MSRGLGHLHGVTNSVRREMGRYSVGSRVLVNDSFPYPGKGLVGIIVAVPSARELGQGVESITVRFDEGQDTPIKRDVTWHHRFFDVIEPVLKEEICVVDLSRAPGLMAALSSRGRSD